MGRRVINGPDRSRLLIDVPTRILIDVRPKDITPAIGSVSLPTFTGTSLFPHPLSSCLVSSLRSSTTMTVTRASVPFVLLEGVDVVRC